MFSRNSVNRSTAHSWSTWVTVACRTVTCPKSGRGADPADSDLWLARGERVGRERALAGDDHGPPLRRQVAVRLPHGPA
jgi:hypothetical protein